MTLLHIDGFEAGDFTTKLITSGASSLSRSATTRHGYGFSAVGQNTQWNKAIPVASAKVTVGVAFRLDNFGSGNPPQIALKADGGATAHAGLYVAANGSVGLTRGVTVIANSAAGLVISGSWHYYELTATISDTVGTMSGRLDGVEVVTFTGDTKNAGTSTNFDAVSFQPQGTNINSYWDDLYILNDLGAAPWNAPLGDVRVLNSVVTGPGNSTALTPSTAPNWGCVDELPPSATDYVQGSTVGTKDSYALADLPAGVSVVHGVQVTLMAKKTDAGARSIKALVRSAGADYSDVATALSTVDATVCSVRQVDPATSAAWTLSAVNALEAGVEIA
jgi:hypothetical protein